MNSFTKIHGCILDSSVWTTDAYTRITWITLLVMADANGFVESSVPGIVHRANVPLKSCRRALERLEAPDPDSKDPDHEGRRIERVAGGFVVLNYRKYRERRSTKQNQAADRARRFRGRHAATRNARNASSRLGIRG